MNTDARRMCLRQTWPVVLAGLLLGCGIPISSKEESPSFEAMLAEAYRLSDGRMIIDQDILVEDEAAARRYYNRHAAPQSAELGQRTQGLTVNQASGSDTLWSTEQRMNLTYCVDTGSFGARAGAFLQALDEASYLWSQRVGVSFQRLNLPRCDRSATQVVFNVRQDALGGALAVAFFPDSASAARELLVDTAAFATTSGGRDLLGILTHELGHTLGARHEHIWLKPTCTRETSADARPVTDYDVDSVMHYPQCRPSGTGGYRPTSLDHAGMITLYGLAPALNMLVSS